MTLQVLNGYLPRGITYPVSPGFLKFRRIWSECMLIAIPTRNMTMPEEKVEKYIISITMGQLEVKLHDLHIVTNQIPVQYTLWYGELMGTDGTGSWIRI